MRAVAWIAVVVVAIAGYATADAFDIAPGFVTLEPLPELPPLADAPPATPASSALTLRSVGEMGAVPDAAALQELAQAVADDPRTGTTGVLVVDVATGAVLADVNGSHVRVPASTTKTLTAIAALHELGPDHRTVTEARWDSDTATVSLVAGGDMMLSADYGHGGATGHPNGWAGLADLADAIVAQTGAVEVTVVVDDSAFPGPAFPAEWPSYALTMGYAAPVTGLAVNIAKTEDANYAARHSDPSLAAANDLADRLAERGVTVAAVRRGQATGEQVARVESAPLSAVVEYLMHVSDNTIAEQVGRVLALEVGESVDPAGAARATVAALEDLGVDTTGLRLYDGAGFSARNRISPHHLVDAMAAAHESANVVSWLDYLALSGVEGTINTRYQDTPAAGSVRAKTGSLTGVTSLAGAVQTADGRWLWFAVMSDGMPYGQDRPRAAADEFMVALAQWGCEGICHLEVESP